MTKASFREAIRMGMADAMREDDTVVLMGEDLRGGKGGINPDPTIVHHAPERVRGSALSADTAPPAARRQARSSRRANQNATF